MGINVCEVIDDAATKPFGFMPFYPGPGLAEKAAKRGDLARRASLSGQPRWSIDYAAYSAAGQLEVNSCHRHRVQS